VDVVFGFGDSTGVADAVAVEGADPGTGVEDVTGTGEEDAGGAPTLTGCAAGVPTGVCAKAVSVKKLKALRSKSTLFISNVTLKGFDFVASSRLKTDPSVARAQDKHVAPAAHFPSLHALRRRNIFGNGQPHVVDTFCVRLNREI